MHNPYYSYTYKMQKSISCFNTRKGKVLVHQNPDNATA